jgi:hypothetical protein
LPVNTHISSHCSISNGIIQKNGKEIFSLHDAPFSEFIAATYNHLAVNYPKFYKMDNLSKLGFIASEILLQKTFLSENYQPEDIGVIISNKHSCLDTDLNYHNAAAQSPSPALFVYTLPNILIGEICIRNKFKGENTFFISEQFNAAFMSDYINGLFQSGIIKACIGGWVDLIGDEYRAFLYLAECGQTDNFAPAHNSENLKKLYLNGHATTHG